MSPIMSPAKRFAAAWRRPGCAVLAVLTGCLLWGTAADARADLATRTHALQTTIERQPVTQMTVNAASDYSILVADSVDPATTITQETAQIHDILAPSLPTQPLAQSWADLLAPTVALPDAPRSAVAAPGSPPKLSVDYRQNLAQHARLIAGHWPNKAVVATDGAMTLEIAVTPSTLSRFDAQVGSKLSLGGGDLLVVTGVVEPTDPAGAFWQSRPVLAAPVLDTSASAPPYWNTAVFVGTGEIDSLQRVFPISNFELSWTVPLATTGYTPAGLPAIADVLTDDLGADSLTLSTDLTPDDDLVIDLTSNLTPTILRFLDEQNTEEIETAMPTASLGVIGLIALALLGRATVDRRGRESALLLARGAPLRELLGRATVDGALTILPVTAVAVAAVLVLPGTTSAGLWRWLTLIPVAALLAPAAFTFVRNARTVYRRIRMNRPPKRTAAHRIVAQATLAALCLAGLEEARTNGLAPSGGIDVFTACAPVLGAALVTILTLNVGPIALRLSLRSARRRRGAIGLLGLGRVVRVPAPTAITVFNLTLALSTADLALALHRSPGLPAVRAAGSSSTTADPLQSAAAMYLAVLAIAALAAGCLIVALAAGADAADRRVTTARLTVMGLTAGQARGVAVAELSVPIVLAAFGGTLAAPPLLWTVRPALAQALGGSGAGLTVGTLAAPVLAVVPLALAAGLIGAALARRGAAGALRLGDSMEGSLT
jgi:hypothetical protein